MTWRVRVANTRLKVAGFSVVCGRCVRVAGKGVREGRLTAESSQPTDGMKVKDNAGKSSAGKRVASGERRDEEKDNAETRRAQRFRKEDGDAGRGWRPMFTMYITANFDGLSSYFLCSNDSNRQHTACKLIKGMGMHGNLVRENDVCMRPG